MTTYGELTYIIMDELKNKSDDGFFQEEHVLFLLDKYRALLLKQRYSDVRKEIPESNYQTICIDLERVSAIDGNPCTGADYMKSVQQIPNIMQVGKVKVTSVDFFQGNFAYTNNERFKYTGNNKYLKNQIYSTVAPDNHLYMKSNNPQLYYLDKVKMTGIFEDGRSAAELSCDTDACDVMDMKFPLEEGLIAQLTTSVLADIYKGLYRPEDSANNASDDLSNLATFLQKNTKSALAKQLDED